jgi:hypothetical protein
MPSVKWAIAIEKRSTQLTESGVFYFRELPGLLQKKRRHQRDQRAPLSSKPVLVFLEQTGKWGFGVPT